MFYYKNLSGNSGVRRYVSDATSITVEFSTGSVYKYTYISAGKHNIEQMKQLAEKGFGLNSFIMRNVRNNYASKF